MNSITKRWIKGSLLITIVLLALAEGFIVFFMRNSYYTAATTAMVNRINTVMGTLAASDKLPNKEKEQLLFRMTEEFSEKDKFEFMLLGIDGTVLATSSGFRPTSDKHVEDLALCQQASDGFYAGSYITQMDEKVLSVTALLPQPAKTVTAVRIITSMTRVDNELYIIFAFSALAVLSIIAFSIISGLYFIRSIVRPIQSIKATAGKISKGEFDVRIENRYNDEIGELCSAINDMAQELGHSDDEKNEFISSISHELRTPLTAIKGWAETMDSTDDLQTIHRGTRVIRSETERLYTMVENLLDFSRLQQAPIVLTKEKLDLVAEVSDVVLMFAPRAKQAQLELVFEEPEIIIPVLADKNRVRQVFVNLLDNALKYSQSGGKIEINMRMDAKKAKVAVEVKDYGRGIHPEDIDKVKQKFYKGKNAKRGSGIGLALVTEIVKAHGGEFVIDSEYKKYTSMCVSFNTIRTLKGK
ncbi:MAG: HAMP domain-containing sensor histidine kinase [Oscillospiraceae bacterium]